MIRRMPQRSIQENRIILNPLAASIRMGWIFCGAQQLRQGKTGSLECMGRPAGGDNRGNTEIKRIRGTGIEIGQYGREMKQA
jgi:hypothetical protein